jgi:histidinol-phosphate aminotransferase
MFTQDTKMKALNANAENIPLRLHLSEIDSASLRHFEKVYCEEFRSISRYPDPECIELKGAIAQRHGVANDNVFVGNGLDEVIFLICNVMLRDGGRSIISEKGFPGYKLSSFANGSGVVEVPLSGFTSDPSRFRDYLDAPVRIAFLCNPFNPCGTLVEKRVVEGFIDDMHLSGVIPIIDEAYIDFAGEAEHSAMDLIRNWENLVVLRSLSKSHGMAGLRVGYAIGGRPIIAALNDRARALPFRVNRLAQRLATEVIADREALTRNISRSRRRVSEMLAVLDALRIKYVPTVTNFIFMYTADFGHFAGMMECRGIRVRDCSGFGFPGWSRVSFATDEECAAFATALSELEHVDKCQQA